MTAPDHAPDSPPDSVPGTDVTADLDDLDPSERVATSDPGAMRDDLGDDPNAASPSGDDAGGAG